VNLFCQTTVKSQSTGVGVLGTNLPESEWNRFIRQQDSLPPSAVWDSHDLFAGSLWTVGDAWCSPGEVVIGNTNLSTFHFTFTSSAPLPKPEAGQKKKKDRKRVRDEDREKRKVRPWRDTGRCLFSLFFSAPPPPFFYRNVVLNLIKAAWKPPSVCRAVQKRLHMPPLAAI